MSIHRAKQLVEQELSSVNALITQHITTDVDLINNVANNIIGAGGKRLRPLLVLLVSKACDYTGEQHLNLATLIEFFHTATLLHDDVIDDSTLRRGRKTANNIWGSKASILVGDYFFSIYLDLLIQVNNQDIMRLLTDITNEITRGEIQQLGNKYNEQLSEAEYFRTIRSKTSLLFAASAASAALLSATDDDIKQAYFNYGLHLGNAFQIIDDMLDYSSNAASIGKNIGDDLAEGKVTLPLLYLINHGSAEQAATVKQTIKTGNLDNLPEIINILNASGALIYTKKIAQQQAELAIKQLDILPDCANKQGLIALTDFAINRDH